MSEVTLFRLIKSSDFDGNTWITLTRDNFTVSGQRNYVATVNGPGGSITGDFFGLFSPDSPKVVGVAFTSANPRSMARVVDSSGRVREEVNLTPFFQYILMNPGDRLSVLTAEALVIGPVPVELTLAVNELTEAQHMSWAIAHPPVVHHHTRLRIVRTGDFVPVPNAVAWIPTFYWNPVSNVLEANDSVSQGPIPISALSPFGRMYGSLFSVRYSNSSGDGRLIVVESQTRASHTAQLNIANAAWSRVSYAAHDDLIALSATTAVVGGALIADIEIVRVEPGDRLRGRFSEAEAVGGHNL
jgi:hypothetical protein